MFKKPLSLSFLVFSFGLTIKGAALPKEKPEERPIQIIMTDNDPTSIDGR